MKPVAALALTAITFSAMAASAPFARAQAIQSSQPVAAKVRAPKADYGKLPLSFEPNRGQTDPSVQWISHGQGYTVFLRSEKADLALTNGKSATTAIHLRLAGANAAAKSTPQDQQITRTNYLIGNDPAKWHSDIPNYSRVRYSSVYPGIDLVYYGNQRQLEHDFIVAPNADPSQIVLTVDGSNSTRIDQTTGDLVLTAKSSELRLLKPVSYQLSNGKRSEVASSYKLLARNQVTFALGSYQHNQPLIIDPILSYSTFLGGSGIQGGYGDNISGLAIDADGNSYLVGTTQSADFPVTSGAYETVSPQAPNASYNTFFVSKLNPTGTALVYSTLLGGTKNAENALANYQISVALDSANNVYLTGKTSSTDFPVTSGAFQSANKSLTAGSTTGFVTKLNNTGTALVYSTYLGGTGSKSQGVPDGGTSIAVDSSGDAFVAGVSYSSDFPVTPHAFQTKNNAVRVRSSNAVITELNPAGTALLYSTYLGGSHGAIEPHIALDGTGSVYIAGSTVDSDFPVTSGAYQTVNHSVSLGENNTFVTKLNATGTALQYSTYLGGSHPNSTGGFGNYYGDRAAAIAVDSNGFAYIAGSATSADFPTTPGVLQASMMGNGLGFVTKLNQTGTALEYSTFLGENRPSALVGFYGTGTGGNVAATGVAVDPAGNAYVAGLCNMALFPSSQDAIETDGFLFLTKLNPDASTASFSSGFNDGAQVYTNPSMALDSAGNVYLAGGVSPYGNAPINTTFPTTSGAFQTVNKAGWTGFATKFALGGITADYYQTQMTVTTSAQTYHLGQSVSITANVASNGGSATPAGVVTFTLSHVQYTSGGSGPVTSTQNVALDEHGSATFTSSSLPMGQYTVSATYAGDASHLTAIAPPAIFSNVGAPAHLNICNMGNSPVNQQILYKQTVGCSVILTDSNLDPIPGTKITFSSSNLYVSPSYAFTDATGTINFTFTAIGVGNTTLTATVSDIAPYLSMSIPWTVSPASLSVSLVEKHRAYGQPNPALTYNVTGLLFGDSVTVTPQTTATISSPVGVYPLTATVIGADASNYNITIHPSTLTISKANLNIIADAVATTYGQTPPKPTGYHLTGFVNGDTASVVSGKPDLSTTVTATTPVGFYPISVGAGTLKATNYQFVTTSNGPGFVGVYKAHLTVTADTVNMIFGGPVPSLTYTITGFVNGETASVVSGAPILSTTATPASSPGTYGITLKDGSLSAQNYAFFPVIHGGVLHITR